MSSRSAWSGSRTSYEYRSGPDIAPGEPSPSEPPTRTWSSSPGSNRHSYGSIPTSPSRSSMTHRERSPTSANPRSHPATGSSTGARRRLLPRRPRPQNRTHPGIPYPTRRLLQPQQMTGSWSISSPSRRARTTAPRHRGLPQRPPRGRLRAQERIIEVPPLEAYKQIQTYKSQIPPSSSPTNSSSPLTAWKPASAPSHRKRTVQPLEDHRRCRPRPARPPLPRILVRASSRRNASSTTSGTPSSSRTQRISLKEDCRIPSIPRHPPGRHVDPLGREG